MKQSKYTKLTKVKGLVQAELLLTRVRATETGGRNRKGGIRVEDWRRNGHKRGKWGEREVAWSSYDGSASLSFMRDTSSYSATETTSSMGQMRPYSSQPCSITRGSDLWGSNMMLLGVTISTPPTTPCKVTYTQQRLTVRDNQPVGIHLN